MRPTRTKVAYKLTLALALASTAVLAAYGYLAVHREYALFDAAKSEVGELLGAVIASYASTAWDDSPDGSAIVELVERLDRKSERLKIRWVPTDPGSTSGEPPDLDPTQIARLRRGNPLALTGKLGEEEQSFYTYVPLPSPAGGAVEIVDSYADRNLYVSASVQRLLVGLGAFIVVNLVLTVLLSYWLIGRPVSRLVAKAQAVGTGDLTTSIDVHRSDEFGTLAGALDRMCDELARAKVKAETEERVRREVEEHARHTERLAVIGRLAAGVAHEVGTPLNVISGRAQRIVRHIHEPSEIRDNASIITEQVDRIAAIVQQLRQFARRRTVKRADTDLGQLARNCVELLGPAIKKSKVSIRVDDDLKASVRVDPIQIQQVLTNLVLNGIEAMPQGGELTVGLGGATRPRPDRREDGPHDCICLYVEDRGGGINDEDLPRIFEPFFTTKDIGEGTGLGLAVVHGIVQEHGGWIDVETTMGKGSRFCVYLPRVLA